jgi:hypothetical protein
MVASLSNSNYSKVTTTVSSNYKAPYRNIDLDEQYSREFKPKPDPNKLANTCLSSILKLFYLTKHSPASNTLAINDCFSNHSEQSGYDSSMNTFSLRTNRTRNTEPVQAEDPQSESTTLREFCIDRAMEAALRKPDQTENAENFLTYLNNNPASPDPNSNKTNKGWSVSNTANELKKMTCIIKTDPSLQNASYPFSILHGDKNSYIRVNAKLGKGGFSAVKSALRQDNTWVAIKIAKGTDLDSIKSLIKEHKIRQHLGMDSELIVSKWTIAGNQEEEPIPVEKQFLVMPLMRMSFQDYLKTGTANDDSIWSYFSDVINGLKHLHDHNVNYRDLKRANVLISQDLSKAQLTDFGMSVILEEGMTSYTDDILAGTTTSLAPESAIATISATGEDQYESSFASDIWSLGTVLIELMNFNVRMTIDRPYFNGTKHIPEYYNAFIEMDDTEISEKLSSYDQMQSIGIRNSPYALKLNPYFELNTFHKRPGLQSILQNCFKQKPQDRWTIYKVKEHADNL